MTNTALDLPRIADASALVGAVGWIAIAAVGPLTRIQSVIALAVLVLVPLGIRLVDTPRRDGCRSRWYRLAVMVQPPAAIAAIASLWMSRGPSATALALPWVAVTVMLAGFGAWRLLQRGPWPLQELAIDAGLLYLPVGSVALVFDRLGVWLFFEPVIITLTVVHFHYAGFVLPLVAGLAGRVSVTGPLRQLLRGTTGFVVFGPAVLAIGISFSPLIEVLAVALFTTAVALFALAVLGGVCPTLSGWPQRLLLGANIVVLPASMIAAVLYGLGAFTGTTYVTIGDMVATHGQLNAFGFALGALVAWRLAPPVSRSRPPGIQFPALGGESTIGTSYFERAGLVADRPASGMVDSLASYARSDFDAESVDAGVRRFVEQSGQYSLGVDPTWSRLGRLVERLYRPIARRTDQLILPRRSARGDSVLTGRVRALDLPGDNPHDGPTARAWVRSNEDRVDDARRLTYAAAYSRHDAGVPLLRVTFPLPIGSLTGLLRFEHDEATDGVVLSSQRATGNGDDAGLYLVIRGFGIRLPVDERITVRPGGSSEPVTAEHEVTLFGFDVVTLQYELVRTDGGEDSSPDHSDRDA